MLITVFCQTLLSGVQLDDKLNFSLHVCNIWKSAANQLSALIMLNNFLCFERKRVLINSYFKSNFNYAPLVWLFSNGTSLKKIDKLQERALLLDKTNNSKMNIKRFHFLRVEIYKQLIIWILVL